MTTFLGSPGLLKGAIVGVDPLIPRPSGIFNPELSYPISGYMRYLEH